MKTWFAYVLLLLSAHSLYAQSESTQTITLVPGWNAIWITVDPADRDPAVVFNGIPVEQAWCYFPTESPVEFIDDPTAGDFNEEAWRVFLPAGSSEEFLTNLHRVLPGRAYLIKLAGPAPATLTVTGKAAKLSPIEWKAGSFNLVGFPVDPALGGGSAELFFFNQPQLNTQQKFRLTPQGRWVVLAPSDPIDRGQAYWIFADTPAEFDGPIQLEVDGGALDFGENLNRKDLRVTNTQTWPLTVTFTPSEGFPLRRATTVEGVTEWEQIDAPFTLTIPGETTINTHLGVSREGLSAGEQLGTVTVSVLGAASVSVPMRVVRSARSIGGGGHAGLWVGDVTLDAVTDVNDPGAGPRPTPADFSLRIILHVDSTGATRLLKQVIMLREDGPAEGDSPFVLVVDEARIANFDGATLKDGQPFGYRVSSAAYDFAGNTLPLGGSFGTALAGTIEIGRDLPTNPLRHRYHPDHDDLDPDYEPIPDPLPVGFTPDAEEVWAITRALSLTFDTPDPDSADPRAGFELLTGSYRETLSNIHRQPITMEGRFTLQRVSEIDALQ